MDFFDVVRERYSCKKYNDKKVEQDKLDNILEAGRLAPTAKNLQEFKVYVFQSEEALAKIDKVTPCRYGASTVIAISFDMDNVYTYPGGKYTSGVEDATIVATHMMLAAKAVGVESCYINCFNPDELAELIELDKNEKLVMLMDLGYPHEEGGPLPNHGIRKEMDLLVKYL